MVFYAPVDMGVRNKHDVAESKMKSRNKLYTQSGFAINGDGYIVNDSTNEK